VEALQGLPGVQEVTEERPGLLRVKVVCQQVIPEIAATVVGVGGRLFRLSPKSSPWRRPTSLYMGKERDESARGDGHCAKGPAGGVVKQGSNAPLGIGSARHPGGHAGPHLPRPPAGTGRIPRLHGSGAAAREASVPNAWGLPSLYAGKQVDPLSPNPA